MLGWHGKARIFLLVDLRGKKIRFRVGGTKKNKKNKKALKMTSQLVIFRAFFFFNIFSFFFFLSPETVKLVIGKPTVYIKSLNILSFS